VTPIPEFLPEVVVKSLGRPLAKLLALLWFLTVTATVLGFRWFGPFARLDSVESKVTAIQVQQRSDSETRAQMVRWMCVKSSPVEIALSGLECR
jgi:hypothetical protein